jgi:hypothetical protein
MKNICFVIFIIIVLTSCKKKEVNDTDSPKINFVISPDITTYKITLSGNRISEYSRFVNNVLQETTSFVFTDSSVDRIINGISPAYTAHTLYTLGNDGYATSSVDSTFVNDTLYSSRNSTYEYANGFLTKTTTHFIQYLPQYDTNFISSTYIIADDNTIKKEYASICTDEYTYNDYPNNLDVRYFSNGITGKSSKNLISHAEWELSCGCHGTFNENAYSDFKYFFDENNRISKMIETKVFCHTSTEPVWRYIYSTTYEYF